MADTRRKVTIYSRSDFMGNIVKCEARLVEHGRRKYAQYDAAPFVKFIPKGKRKVRGILKGYNSYFVIIDGWGHPDPDSPWTELDHSGVLPTQRSLYSSCDSRWVADFENKLGEYLTSEKVTLVADYRKGSPTETLLH